MTHSQMYLFTRLDAVKDVLYGFIPVFSTIVLILVIAAIVIWVAAIEDRRRETPEESDSRRSLASLYIRKCVYTSIPFMVFLLFCIIGHALVPTQKEAAAIYLVPKIVNNDRVQDIGDTGMELIEGKMKEWLKDLKKNSK